MFKRHRIIKIVVASVFFLLAAGGAIMFWFWQGEYRDAIYPGVSVGDVDLGGQTPAGASDLIAARADQITNDGLTFRYDGRTAVLPAVTASFDSDLSYPVLSFSPADTAAAAYGPAADRDFWHYLLSCFESKSAQRVNAVYTLDANQVSQFLAANFPDLNIDPTNAYFSLADTATGTGLVSHPEQTGKTIDYDVAIAAATAELNGLADDPIAIQTKSSYPTVKESDLAGLAGVAQNIAGRGALVLRAPAATNGQALATTTVWTVEPAEIIAWAKAANDNGRLTLVLDQNKIAAYLQAAVAPDLDQEPVLPRFAIKNGKVTDWQTGLSGRRLDATTTAAEIADDFLTGTGDITVVTQDISPANLTASNDFKIKEIIGTGHSRFAGSPPHRIHNIKVGAAALQGLLIKPGENFSLVNALGAVDAGTGYLTELVIKGNETTPEYGGGLCQIGTTIFRTALASGLPITERQNHSYRVSYYEPAGTDATIYDPQPDLRFVNDTGNYILIQSRISGNDLYFDFWGVSDGRTATTTYPVIYNIVKPEPTKIIETTDLPPGQKKCTESSHNGADAYFDYTVAYPADSTSTSYTRRFSSHYVPWQAVCLVGVAATSTPGMASSTAPISNAAGSMQQ